MLSTKFSTRAALQLYHGIIHALEYSTDVQVSARALINLRFQYLLKCALTVSAHVLRFQYLLTYFNHSEVKPDLNTKKRMA